MPTFTRRQFMGGLTATALSGRMGLSAAQGANAPLRVIVPASAGSGQDAMVRAAQLAMARVFNRPVVVENLPGSGGIIGTQQLVRAAPDGNTIAFVSNNHVVNPAVYKKLPFDSLNDITPITVVGETPFMLVVNPAKLPANDAKEFAALLKAQPGRYNFGSSGNGTILHLAAEMCIESVGAKARHIPYKGAGPMLTDLLGGQIDFGVLAVPVIQGHLKSGALKAVAATGAQRAPSLPNIPTMKEQGFDAVVGGWLAAVGPAHLQAAEVQRLHTAIVAAWTAPDAKKALLEQDNIIHPTSAAEARTIFARDLKVYADLVKKVGVTLD